MREKRTTGTRLHGTSELSVGNKRGSSSSTSSLFSSNYFPFKMAFIVCSSAIALWYIYSSAFVVQSNQEFSLEKERHQMKSVRNDLLQKVSQMSDGENFEEFRSILRPFLRTRVPDTEGNAVVRQHIESHLSSLGWDVEPDSFESNTPLGKKSFTNIVATSNPHAKRHLVLACHHDSKFFENLEFIGASDSAVPCAIMLAIAQQLDSFINKNSTSLRVALKFIFFDGEEAFVQWSRTDSLYGSRDLAEKMGREMVDVGGVMVSKLDQIDLFVLLDLIGTKDTSFVSFKHDDKFYSRLVSAEKRFKRQNLLNYGDLQDGNRHVYFKQNEMPGRWIEDDHLPFMDRGVRILHLISYPFPLVWHTENDDAAHLHYPTINNVMKCIRLFTIEYLGFQVD